jgi:CRISPR/Cas system CSM-associated protein Csm4 (group 5 of RAMP superfamily)
MNLSLFRPTKAELKELEDNDGCLQYRLEQRGGFVVGYRSFLQKTPHHYFLEGSIFKKLAGHTEKLMGGLHKHSFEGLEHDVWDNGFGFMVNLKWTEQ